MMSRPVLFQRKIPYLHPLQYPLPENTRNCIFCWSFWRFYQSVSLVWLELGELPGGTSCDSTSLAPPWRHCWWMLVTGHITSRIIWLTSYQNASKIEHYQSAFMVIISLSMLSMLPSEREASSTLILPKALLFINISKVPGNVCQSANARSRWNSWSHQHDGFPTPMAYEFKWKVPASRNKDSETGLRPKQAEIRRMKLYQIEVWKVLMFDVFFVFWTYLRFLSHTCDMRRMCERTYLRFRKQNDRRSKSSTTALEMPNRTNSQKGNSK